MTRIVRWGIIMSLIILAAFAAVTTHADGWRGRIIAPQVQQLDPELCIGAGTGPCYGILPLTACHEWILDADGHLKKCFCKKDATVEVGTKCMKYAKITLEDITCPSNPKIPPSYTHRMAKVRT